MAARTAAAARSAASGRTAAAARTAAAVRSLSFATPSEAVWGRHSMGLFATGYDCHHVDEVNGRLYGRKKDDVAGSDIWQGYWLDLETGEATCFTNPAPSGAPANTRHKGFAFARPQGDWLIIPVEMASHFGDTDRDESATSVSNGWWANLWATRLPDFTDWTQLTSDEQSTAPPITPDGQVYGSFYCRFNAAGDRVLFSRLVGNFTDGDDVLDAYDSFADAHGKYKLYLAKFAEVDGVPTLSDITEVDSGATFAEAHGFHPTKPDLVYASTDRGLTPGQSYGMDIWEYDLRGGTPRNLTPSYFDWDEHWTVSPDGKYAVWTTSREQVPAFDIRRKSTLKLDLWGMRLSDGKVQRLTFFNTAGHPEYQGGVASLALLGAWRGDSVTLLVTQGPLSGGSNEVWKLVLRPHS